MITDNDRQAELSYAYLHAVASAMKASCSYSTRTEDGMGIDARLTLVRDFGALSKLTDTEVHVQLKSTIKSPGTHTEVLKYELDIDSYNRLRSTTRSTPIILVVLFLPDEPATFVEHTVAELKIRRCAYWVSLHGAPASANSTSVTISIPRSNTLTTDALETVFEKASRPESIPHGQL